MRTRFVEFHRLTPVIPAQHRSAVAVDLAATTTGDDSMQNYSKRAGERHSHRFTSSTRCVYCHPQPFKEPEVIHRRVKRRGGPRGRPEPSPAATTATA